MSQLNHFAISAILGSEIVGPVRVGHGQVASLGDAQLYLNSLTTNEPPAIEHRDEHVDVEKVKEAFFAVRNKRGDLGSTDIYIADPERNREFLGVCRKLGIVASDFKINRALFNARKNKHLPDLKSKTTKLKCPDCMFASEFAATQLRYRTGASIDDILCDPKLAVRFDALAQTITPGHRPVDYRWTILSIRKAGRHGKAPATLRLPKFSAVFNPFKDSIKDIPDKRGVYLLYERQKLLYTRSTMNLRHEIGIHRDPKVFEAIAEKLWLPSPDSFGIEYAALARPMSVLQAIERKIIEERHPLFNVPRTAA